MNKILSIIRAFFGFQRNRSKRSKNHLPVKVHRQWTSYSCTAAVAQMVAGYYGVRMSHPKAIRLTKCKPDGAQLHDVAKALKRTHGFQYKTLTRRAQVRQALRKGLPVISNDSCTYADDHAILVVGQTPKGFYIADPVPAEIYWRHEKRFFGSAQEFISVAGP